MMMTACPAPILATVPPEGFATSHQWVMQLRPDDAPLGFGIGGASAGPNLAIFAARDLGELVYPRLLALPTINRIRGRLFLIYLEPDSCHDDTDALRCAMDLREPLDELMVLPSIRVSQLGLGARDELVRRSYWAVLRRCAGLGMISGRGIPRETDARNHHLEFDVDVPPLWRS